MFLPAAWSAPMNHDSPALRRLIPRNPFTPPREIHDVFVGSGKDKAPPQKQKRVVSRTADRAPIVVPAPRFSLVGIVVTSRGRTALVATQSGTRAAGEGAVIDGYTVSAIRPGDRGMTVTRGGRSFPLRL
jgi:hypothetical protein